MSIVLNGDSGITTPTYGGADTAEYLVPVTQFKNKLINSDMRIDQRNAGAAVTNPGDATVYLVDRWNQRENTDAQLTFQQVSDAPAGFVSSLRATVTTADSSIAATDYAVVRQFIEGFNTADLNWGTANAKTVTLSFWVKSSVTGTYGGALTNDGTDRCYVFSYTISSANTWEYKTVTIAGDTTGTWLTNNGIGIRVIFGLTVGTTFSKAAGSWNSTNAFSVTGNTALISTLNATWLLTGVQLEVGSTATSFDYRPYGTELALCQRYYYRTKASAAGNYFCTGMAVSTTAVELVVPVSETMRTNPTALEQSGTASDYSVINSSGVATNLSSVLVFGNATNNMMRISGTVSSGLTGGAGTILRANNTSAYLGFSAEL